MEKIIIGRKDKIDLPDLALFNIDAKIDTGAYTSSIHCYQIQLTKNNGVATVRFKLLDPSHPDYNEREFLLPVHQFKSVKSSSGHTEERIFIKTNILIFDQLFEIELSLTDRSDMKHPVLIGRKLLKNRFIVDVSKFNLSYRQKRRSHENKGELIK